MANNNIANNNMADNGTTRRNTWSGRNVLVTGLTGFIGGWVAAALLDAGAQVVGIVRSKPNDSSENENVSTLELLDLENRAHFVEGSIADYSAVERTLVDYEVDTVFHLAAETIVGVANRSPLSFFESNIKGTWNILDAVRTSNTIERVVIASSDKAYGDQKELPYTEETTLNGLYPYDASKACTDILARAYAHTYDLPIVVTRCANVYGGADLNWSRLVPGTIRSIICDENPVLRSDGTSQRDYIYVEDAVDAYLQAGENAANNEVCGKAFNFGSGVPVSARTMVEQLLHVSGRTDLFPDIQGEGKPHGEIDQQYLDSSQAKQTFGWEPKVDLETGLQHTIDWFKEHATKLNIVGGLCGLLPKVEEQVQIVLWQWMQFA
jgi:CDP-glucose 4,6-dehydratase